MRSMRERFAACLVTARHYTGVNRAQAKARPTFTRCCNADALHVLRLCRVRNTYIAKQLSATQMARPADAE
jgi:hypothetical protein